MRSKLLAAGIAIAILCVAFCSIGAYQIVRSLIAKSLFRPIQCAVTRSGTVEIKKWRGGRRGAFTTKHKPLVEYSYSTDNAAQLHGDRLFLFEQAGSKEWAESVSRQYPIGTRTIAFVSPYSQEDVYLVIYQSVSIYAFVMAAFPAAILAIVCFDPNYSTVKQRGFRLWQAWTVTSGIIALHYIYLFDGDLRAQDGAVLALFVLAGLVAKRTVLPAASRLIDPVLGQ
ncbi:MAG: hypothetical protein J0M17_09145 [Planctomycetes bacterium]|nr:hypothetical protein [Planctomycetota bacterium]